jgi:hypothetical protein
MELGSYFLFLQEQIKDIIIIMVTVYWVGSHMKDASRECTDRVALQVEGHEQRELVKDACLQYADQHVCSKYKTHFWA